MKKAMIAAALCLAATFAMADGGHGGPGMSGGPGDFGRGGDEGLLVGTDGTVYLVHSTSTTTTAAEEVAINTAGTVVFRSALVNGRGHLTLSGANLISVTENAATATTAASSTLTALSASTGAQVWTLTLDGRVGELRPFNGGTYAIVTIPSATAGTAPTRTLVAISNSGAILFKVAI